MESRFPILLILLSLALILLLIQFIRLRLELWANRRIIAALEQQGNRPAKPSGSRTPELLAWTLLLLILGQLLGSLLLG